MPAPDPPPRGRTAGDAAPLLAGSTITHVLRGFRRRCPGCGAGALYRGYLTPVAQCGQCGEAFNHIRADDFPPYLTVLLVGPLVVPLILLAERQGATLELQIALWVPMTLALTLLLLPRVKGAIIGLMWSLGMSAPAPR